MTDPIDDRSRRHDQELEEVAQVVRGLRRRAGLTQQQLAERMTANGVPTKRQQVSAWEAGPPNGQAPTSGKLLAIFRATRPPRQRERVEAEIAELEDRLGSLQDDLARLDRDT